MVSDGVDPPVDPAAALHASGERVLRPEYGCDLHRLVFSPNDATTAGLAVHYVRAALLRWEPRIEIRPAGRRGG